jgi:hypothetical protein
VDPHKPCGDKYLGLLLKQFVIHGKNLETQTA